MFSNQKSECSKVIKLMWYSYTTDRHNNFCVCGNIRSLSHLLPQNTIPLPIALCHLLTSANSVTLCVTASYWPVLNCAKRIICRTVSQFLISSRETLFRIPSTSHLRSYFVSFLFSFMLFIL